MTSILVVDDDEDIRFLYAHALRNDYDIIEASTGAEALELFEKIDPNAVIMDTKLPDMSGIDVSKRMLEINNDTIIIGATGFSDRDDDFLEIGAVKVIHKPFSMNRLREVMNTILQC